MIKKTISIEELMTEEYSWMLNERSVASYQKTGKLQTRVKNTIIDSLKQYYENVEYVKGKKGVKPSFILAGRRETKIAKKDNRSGNVGGNNNLEYRDPMEKVLTNWLSGKSFAKKKIQLYTPFSVMYELGLLVDRQSVGKLASFGHNHSEVLGSAVKNILIENRRHFNSFIPFKYDGYEFKDEYVNRRFKRDQNNIVNEIDQELHRISRKVFVKWLEKYQINYETYYIGNINDVPSEYIVEGRDHYSRNTVFIEPKEYREYLDLLVKSKRNEDIILKDETIQKLGFNYAYEAFMFTDNDHLSPVDVDGLVEDARAKLYDRLMRKAEKQNVKDPSYKDQEVDNLGVKIFSEKWDFKARGHREYFKLMKLIYSELLNINQITQRELEVKSSGTPSKLRNKRTPIVKLIEGGKSSFKGGKKICGTKEDAEFEMSNIYYMNFSYEDRKRTLI